MTASKQKGTLLERVIADYLGKFFPGTDRRPLGGTKDKGDLIVPGMQFTVEVKNCKQMKLAQWVDEANVEAKNAGLPFGVVVHKRVGKGNPGDQYVTMDLDTFIGLVTLTWQA